MTDAKVMTFTAAKCGHNLPQTSLLLGEVIPTSNQKKNLAAPSGLRWLMYGPNSKLSGGQLRETSWKFVPAPNHLLRFPCLYVYYESIKRELKTKLICECRYDERLKTKVEESTHLTYTVLYDKTNFTNELLFIMNRQSES